jgi:hypothetical protein
MFIVAALCLTASCKDYLDVVPDLVGTIDYAFSTRNTTEKYLRTCYSYLPAYASTGTVAMVAGNEIWGDIDNGYNTSDPGRFAQGAQNASNPWGNAWDGGLFMGIRDCNIFLENINIPYDIDEDERNQWIAEVKFLKAYYHFYLLQLYGPVPIIRENLSIGADVEEVRVFREPVDDVVDYIVGLIDEALPYLLLSYEDSRTENGGRITQPTAAAIKAKTLVLAASPLLNGTADEAPEFSLVDKRGVQLFPQEYKAEKWERAREAVAQAIEISHRAGHRLYGMDMLQYVSAYITDTTLHKLALRFAICEGFNREIIWASVENTIGSGEIQMAFVPNIGLYNAINSQPSSHGTTLKVAEEFYTRNGLPIEEDDEWINKWLGGSLSQRYEYAQISVTPGSGINGVSSISEDHKYYLGAYRSNTGDWRTHGKIARAGTLQYTGKLHFYREPRFYAWIGCDRGIWEIGTWSDTAQIPGAVTAFASPVNYVLATKFGEDQGKYDNTNAARHIPCGYFVKKLVSPEFNRANTGVTTGHNYVGSQNMTYPIIRLSDLYLLYAETLNETKSTPDADVYQWIDTVRARARLEPVVQAWQKYAISSAKNKPLTKAGMREIIKRERMIELSFESQKFFDLLRWKDAMNYLRQPIQGWNLNGGGYEDEQRNLDAYYRVTTYMNGTPFNSRNYFWPVSKTSLRNNTNLVQNPGWEGIGN